MRHPQQEDGEAFDDLQMKRKGREDGGKGSAQRAGRGTDQTCLPISRGGITDALQP